MSEFIYRNTGYYSYTYTTTHAVDKLTGKCIASEQCMSNVHWTCTVHLLCSFQYNTAQPSITLHCSRYACNIIMEPIVTLHEKTKHNALAVNLRYRICCNYGATLF